MIIYSNYNFRTCEKYKKDLIKVMNASKYLEEGTKTPQNAMTAEAVAKFAYKRFMKNKEITISGLVNRLKNLFPVKFKMTVVAKMKY